MPQITADIPPTTADLRPAEVEPSNGAKDPNLKEVKAAAEEAVDSTKDMDKSFKKSPRFWVIMATLCVIGLLAAFENTVVATSLPFIVEDLGLGENYIWVTNSFFLTSAAVQPLFGQLANIFGRRWLTMAIVAFFVFGSGLAGGANNAATLIAGRAIQGIGSGGINLIVDIIVSDLVPLRERGNYISIVLSVYFIGMAIGPLLGGVIVDHTNWRWVSLQSACFLFMDFS